VSGSHPPLIDATQNTDSSSSRELGFRDDTEITIRLSLGVVFAISFLFPGRVGGAGIGFACLVVGQVLMGLLLSHWGALGSAVDPFSVRKAGGVLLVLAGAWLTQT
jgi:hypothetical protein